MLGPHATLVFLVVLTSLVAWVVTRRRVAAVVDTAALPPPRLFSFTATVAVLALGIGVVITWAPSVTAVDCTQAMIEAGRCRASSLTGATGLMLFLCPLGVTLAYLWSEGALSPSEPRPPGSVAAAPGGEEATEHDEEAPGEPEAVDPRLTRALVDGEAVSLSSAIETAAERLRGKQVALVFSGAASKHANDALAQLAQALDGPRFLAAEDGPHAAVAREAAGELASHADELALALAGGLYEGVVLLDARAEFHELTLMSLRMLASVCLAEEPTTASQACAIVLPAASEEEAERARAGEDLAGDRRPRAYLVTLLRRALAPEWAPPSREDGERA